MTAELLLALTGYALVMSMTPGPNNLMLLASGVNFGFRRTIPHMLGVGCGFIFMLLLVGLGIGQLLQANPAIYTALKYASLAYMTWLAWKIAHSGPVTASDDAPPAKPITFIEAALFQWLNPKGWAAALTAITAFTNPHNYLQSLLIVAAVFTAANVPSVTTWTAFGIALRSVLEAPRNVRIFNILMAALLMASIVPIAWELV
jgi:threonine/homoserine/homoserine lactone efflux protein